MADFSPFQAAAATPGETAAAGNLQVVGFLCSYTPEELIHAAGFHPMRLFSSKSDISLAENHLQAYCCSLVRGVLEDSLAGRLDFLHGTVFPHTCDSVQRLSDIWRLRGRYAFFSDVVLPAKLNTDSAKKYMALTLGRFRADLEKAAGRPVTDEDLFRSIRLYNRIRKGLSALYDIRAKNPGAIRGNDLSAVVKGCMVMDREEAAGHLENLVQDPAWDRPAKSDGKRIFLSGSICDMPGIADALEQAGATVVGDDLCTGQRWFEGLIDEDTPPMEALTARYSDRLICPAKHRGIRERGEQLVKRVKQAKADGVIFLLLKFCDPHAFDYPYLAERLEKEGIRHLHLEVDDQQDALGQISTRLETFVHMI